MNKAQNKPIIFNYLDYRKFLNDWYTHTKQTRRGFSHRAFSKKAGFGSPNFLKRVMEGDRSLTQDSMLSVIKGLDLNKQEADFFKKLVLFNQSQTHEQKDVYYRQLVQSQKMSKLKPIAKEQYEYYASWHHPVVRELVVSPECDGTPEWVAAHIEPKLTVVQAERSIALLEQLGLIQRIKGEKWMQSEPLLTTGAEATELSLVNYHQSVLDLVKQQLPRIPAEQRDVSVLTLGIKKENLPLLKKRMQEFRKDILKFVADDTAENVVLLAMQLVPVSIV